MGDLYVCVATVDTSMRNANERMKMRAFRPLCPTYALWSMLASEGGIGIVDGVANSLSLFIFVMQLKETHHAASASDSSAAPRKNHKNFGHSDGDEYGESDGGDDNDKENSNPHAPQVFEDDSEQDDDGYDDYYEGKHGHEDDEDDEHLEVRAALRCFACV